MKPWAPPLACLLALLLTQGCRGPGPRRPLLGGDPPTPQLNPNTPSAPPPRPPDAEETARLLDELRQADDDGRARLVEQLLARGPQARPLVEGVLAEEQVLVDVLGDLLTRLGPMAQAQVDGPGRLETPPWVQEKYRLALDRYLAGDVYAAIRAIDAILALEPDTRLRQKLLRLRRACRQRLLRESVLHASLTTGSDRALPGHALRARVELKNLSGETLTLRLAPDRRLGTLDVDYEELSPDGAHTRTRTQRPIRLEEDELILRAGESRSLAIELPTTHRGLPPGLVGRYHLSGRLRAQTMLVGEAAYPVFVPLFPYAVVIVTAADWQLTQEPEAGFAEAVVAAQSGSLKERQEPARRAFVASILMAQEDRDVALRAMAQALEGATGPLSDALCAGLARVTGEPLNFTRQEWLIWWKGRESRPTKEQVPEAEAGDPR